MKQLIKSATALAVGAVLSLTAVDALAHKEGDFILRVGAAHVSPNDDSSNVLGANDGVTVDSATGLGFSGTWMLSDNWGFRSISGVAIQA